MQNIISLQNLNCRILTINFEDIEFPTNVLSFIDCGDCILILLNFNQEYFGISNRFIINYSSNVWCIDSKTNSIKWTSSSLHRTHEYFVHFDLIDKRIYAVTNKKNLYEIDVNTGKISM